MEFHENMSKLLSRHKNCQHTKGNKSKSRNTRVTVYVFGISSHGVKRLCEVS